MVTVSELVVAIRGEGIDQTQEDLEGMEDSVEQSTESLSDQSDELEDLSTEFAGALSVAAVGLAVATGSLLSTIPVLGEAFNGLFAIVQSVGLTMDNVLRPALTPLVNGFFELSTAIGQLNDGPLGTLVGIFATVATVIGGLLLGPVGLLGAALAGLGVGAILALTNFEQFKAGLQRVATFIRERAPGAFQRLKEIVSQALGTLAKVIKENLPKVVNGLIGLGKDIVSTIRKTMQETDFNQLGRTVMGSIIDAIVKFVSFASDVAGDIMGVIKENFEDYTWEQFGRDVISFIADALRSAAQFKSGMQDALAEALLDVITNTDWVQVGKDIMRAVGNGIKAAAGFASGATEQVMKEIDEYLPSSPADKGPLSDLDKAGPGLIDEFAGGIQARTRQVTSATENAMSASQTDSTGRLPRPRNQTTKLFIDGREAGRGTQSERFDESARRGQTF